MHQDVRLPASKTPLEEAQARLADARVRVLAHEKAVRDIEREQERRLRDLASTKLALEQAKNHHEQFVEHVVNFAAWKGSTKLKKRTYDAVIALQEQISRGKRELKKNQEALGRTRAEAAVTEKEVAQYGRLLTLPERPKRRRTNRHADER